MAYKFEKNGQDTDIVISGWENGIARSPLSGIANMQNVNIATENKEVMNSYGRVQQTATTSTASGTVAFQDASHVTLSIASSNNQFKGMWITVFNSSNTGQLANGNYYVLQTGGTGFVLATTYNGDSLTTFGSGLTANFTILRGMAKPIASTTETYTMSGVKYYRYYILDAAGSVWVYDTINELSSSTISPDYVSWANPDPSLSYFTGTAPTGIAVYNGWLHVFAGDTIFIKPTVNLADTASASSNWVSFAPGGMNGTPTNSSPHFAYVGRQGTLLYTDGSFIGSIFANSSLLSGAANIQSYAQYTAATTTGTISQLFSGSTPTSGSTTPRIPATFFTSLTTGASLPSAITANTTYYIEYSRGSDTFQVFAALSGGSALDIATGAVGTQYFNTYYPGGSSGTATITFTPQALNLPANETTTAITEIGNLVIIGTQSNFLYPWNQVDTTPQDIISLPENNTVHLLTVNNMAYVFAGNKGNIYVTNGSTATLVTSVPDYCAGVPGSAQSYVEPYFVWGGVMYSRGKVYFSIQDQTAATSTFLAKTGNCGGIWSFVPTQNFYYGQDTGLSLRMENTNSYDTLNGAASVLIKSQSQLGRGTQYWSGWYDGLSSVKYGVDFTDTSPNPATPALIETDLIPTGTLLNKGTFKQIEYKLAAPLVTGESVNLYYRLNATSAWTSCGTIVTEAASGVADLSGYVSVNFQRGQWLQLQAILNPTTGVVTNSFVRLVELRIR